MFFNKKYKKIISIFLVTSFLVPSLLFTQPNKVDAATTVTDPGNTGISIINMIKNGISVGFDKIASAAAWATENKEFVLDGLAWTAAKLLIRQMTTSIVNWINNGFEGPLFVTNLEDMLFNIADQVIGEYIEGTDLAFLCDPFSIDIKLALWNTFYESDAPSCTLSDIIDNAGGALTSLENDFRWGTWIEMTTEDNNNTYGAYLQAESEILDEIFAATEKMKTQANWGEGFLSWEDCEMWDGADCEDGQCNQVEHCEIKTPGSVLESKLNHTLGLTEDSLVTADEFNEVAGALFMQLVKSIMSTTGLLGQNDMSSYDNSQSLGSIKTNINSKINDSLAFEVEYNKIKNDSYRLILGARDLILDLIDCLTVTHETDKLDLANKLLTEPIIFTQPSFTIDLYTLENNLYNDIVESDEIILVLNTFKDETLLSNTANQLNEIMVKYGTLAPYVHGLIEISDAEIERDGYGTSASGLPMGISYDINRLINTRISNYDYYIPETNKGIQQRYDECILCKDSNTCTIRE
ncbi:MAG: hypothetical protein KAJ58_00405 [Candidatus Pacebacteria bacterium]|nr:hypothetical protein [Candidatus Paceibacterota bacterium]